MNLAAETKRAKETNLSIAAPVLINGGANGQGEILSVFNLCNVNITNAGSQNDGTSAWSATMGFRLKDITRYWKSRTADALSAVALRAMAPASGFILTMITIVAEVSDRAVTVYEGFFAAGAIRRLGYLGVMLAVMRKRSST
jgi:hypothetical protein